MGLLLGKDFITKPTPTRERKEPIETPPEKIIRVEGFDVHINPAGTYIVTEIKGKLGMVTIEEYKQRLAQHLTEEVRTPEDFRSYWIRDGSQKSSGAS